VALRAIVADYHDAYASARAVITDHLDALVRLLVAPALAVRASGSAAPNVLERSLFEVRRRTNVIRRFPGETAPSASRGRARAHQPSLARRRHDPSQRRRQRTPPPWPHSAAISGRHDRRFRPDAVVSADAHEAARSERTAGAEEVTGGTLGSRALR